jgi:glycine hydroxymethyltransferase
MAHNSRREGIENLVVEHETWRAGCVNLIASENVQSPFVRRYLDSDLSQRYADYAGRDLGARKYRGTRWVEQIEAQVIQLASELYGAQYIELRAISGHIAGAAVIMALTRPGDIILEASRDLGSHRMATKLGMTPALPLDVRFLPFDPWAYNVDVAKTLEMIERFHPRMVILGSSSFLFPHPVRELAEALRAYPETVLVYDASHVLGLIGGKRFQDPIAEGAHLVFGSTHKTLPGPQGGLILSNDESLMERIAQAVYPALITNHHLFRLPALGIALLELKYWGSAYANQIVGNAQQLGAAIQAQGIDVIAKDGRYTESHTLLLQVAPFGSGEEVAARLEAANLIVNAAHLPDVFGSEGIRIGVQEITRMGAREDDMDLLAELIAAVITGTKSPQDCLSQVKGFASCFQKVHFTWSE